jgi:plasmid stabilization system protein ParE
MPRGDKSAYTDKQKRQAEHIEEGYEERGVPEEEAERRAWATVNKMTGGGKKTGAGRGKTTNKAPARKGGKTGGTARRSSATKKAARSSARRETSGKTAQKSKARSSAAK